MLEVRGVNKRLGSFCMRDMSFHIERGEYLVLLGPSGVGKTVLIETIAGLIKPDSGSIFYDGEDITALAPELRHFAVVYQDYALFPHLTVRGNIEFGPRSLGIRGDELDRRVKDAAGKIGIEGLLDRRTERLSGGEKQRVAVARALAAEPRVLLLDEPLSALDTNVRIRLRKELKQISSDLGIPVLHVTHDPEEAMVLGDRICVMLDSQIRQIDKPGDLFHRPTDADVSRFLGIKNVLEVGSIRDDVCVVDGSNIHVSSAEESTSHIWIRPEEILLSKDAFESSARNQFKCRVLDLEHRGSLISVRVGYDGLELVALITFASMEKMGLKEGSEVYVTFKSSAVHCF